MKMFFDPQAAPITVQDRSGRVLSRQEVSDLANRRVKWARRNGARVAVMLDGPVKGEAGILLYFPKPSEYDVAIRRVFGPPGSREY